MKALYIILSALGWTWTAVFFLVLWWNARQRKHQAKVKGFDVITHDPQH
jgi:hypothetical protein